MTTTRRQVRHYQQLANGAGEVATPVFIGSDDRPTGGLPDMEGLCGKCGSPVTVDPRLNLWVHTWDGLIHCGGDATPDYSESHSPRCGDVYTTRDGVDHYCQLASDHRGDHLEDCTQDVIDATGVCTYTWPQP